MFLEHYCFRKKNWIIPDFFSFFLAVIIIHLLPSFIQKKNTSFCVKHCLYCTDKINYVGTIIVTFYVLALSFKNSIVWKQKLVCPYFFFIIFMFLLFLFFSNKPLYSLWLCWFWQLKVQQAMKASVKGHVIWFKLFFSLFSFIFRFILPL